MNLLWGTFEESRTQRRETASHGQEKMDSVGLEGSATLWGREVNSSVEQVPARAAGWAETWRQGIQWVTGASGGAWRQAPSSGSGVWSSILGLCMVPGVPTSCHGACEVPSEDSQKQGVSVNLRRGSLESSRYHGEEERKQNSGLNIIKALFVPAGCWHLESFRIEIFDMDVDEGKTI